MAKKNGFLKFVIGAGALAVAGKVAYDKVKETKEKFVKEEEESVDAEVKKYNAIFEKKEIEVEDEVFTGCEVKTICSNAILDLGLAVFEKDVYVNFTSTASNLTIILPEGVNATCDIEKKCSGVRNLVENVDEDGIHTVYIIGTATCSNVEVIPVNFYVDEDDFEDDDFETDEAAMVDFVDDTEEMLESVEEAKALDEVIFDEKEDDVEIEIKVVDEK